MNTATGTNMCKSFKLALLILCAVFVTIFTQQADAASAVAFDSQRSVYSYRYGYSDVNTARRAAVNSCRRRGGRRCRIIASCSGGGYGMIYMRRATRGRILAIGASCGARTRSLANEGAKRSCNRYLSRGRCGGPKVSWYDPVRAPRRRGLRSNLYYPYLDLPGIKSL